MAAGMRAAATPDSVQRMNTAQLDSPLARERVADSPRSSRLARALLRIVRITGVASRPLSGRRLFPLWAIVYHRGRRSGRLLATPVAVRSTPDGFVIALPFEGAQWFRNVLAAGECVVRWKGVDHPAVEPRIIDWAAARSAFNPLQRLVMETARVDRYLSLRRTITPQPAAD
jgi:deazaflavin-dependent oxidoreductase (nitroreductase family)